MQKFMNDIIKRICATTNLLAGACFFSVMALVLANIVMRNFFRLAILGTVEIVGLLTATGLGLALANTEMIDFNIAMDIVTEKLSRGKQLIISIAVYSISVCFWAIVVWRTFVYASTSFTNGRVTSTASIPIYPFVFILGFNLLCLCAVLAYKLIGYIKDASEEFGGLDRGEKEANL